jgi:hypothetical protein
MKHIYHGIIFFVSLFAGQLKAQCNYTTAVPYYESFESISANNQFPSCWAASNPSVTCLTYTTSLTQNRVPRTGYDFASFYYAPSGVNYFYTNGILLNAGSTYSVSLWYTTEYYGYNNWTDLSVSIGYSQTPSTQTVVASTGSPVISNIYKSLSNTFTVPVTGIYYAAIRATGSNASNAEYLSFDDFLIEQTCNVNVSVVASATAGCAGQPITFTAMGANTYTWSDGSQGPVATLTPAISGFTSFSVTGTQMPSGCKSGTTINVMVNPAPQLSALATSTAICLGQSTSLHAFGASSYTWGSTQYTSNVIVVSPTVTTTYTVFGSNQYGCSSGSQVIQVVVWPLPVITISTSAGSGTVCSGDALILTAHGAPTFTWMSGTATSVGGQLTATLNAPVNFTVKGADGNGCIATSSIAISVVECLGIDKHRATDERLLVYPNPFNENLTVRSKDNFIMSVELYNITGQRLLSIESISGNAVVNTQGLGKGVYFLKVQSDGRLELLKVIKN